MGTSSILAGCIISAAWTAVGVEYSVDDVILAVSTDLTHRVAQAAS